MQKIHPPSASANIIPQSTPPSGLPASPMKTPKEANKKYLARDILRALKRPRPESLAVQGPESKRHASEATAVNPYNILRSLHQVNSSSSLKAAQPGFSTFALSHPVNSTPTNFAVGQSTAPATQQMAAAPMVSSHSLTQAQSSTERTGKSIVQTFTGSQPLTDQTRTKINLGQFKSFGQSSGPTPYHHTFQLSNAFTRTAEVNHVARAPLPKVRVLDQPSSKVQVESQTSSKVQVEPQTSSKVQVEPQISVAPIPATDAPASSSVLVSHTSLAPMEKESNNARSKELPIDPSPDKAAEKIEPTPPLPNKTPLFLPSPTSSGTTSGGTIEVIEMISTGEKSKRKTKAGVPSSFLLPSLQSTAMTTNKVTNLAFVLVPPMPDYARKWRKQDASSDAPRQGSDHLGILSQSRSLGNHSRLQSFKSIPPEGVKAIDDEESDIVEGVHR